MFGHYGDGNFIGKCNCLENNVTNNAKMCKIWTLFSRFELALFCKNVRPVLTESKLFAVLSVLFFTKLSWSTSLVVVQYTALLSMCVSKTGIPERTNIISSNWMTKCSFWPLFHLQPLPLLCRDIVSKFQFSACEQHLPEAKSIDLPMRHRNLSGESGPLICMKAASPSQRLKETATDT